MPNNKKDKNTTTKSESVKLQPRNVNKSVKNVFELKKKSLAKEGSKETVFLTGFTNTFIYIFRYKLNTF
jgi:hypothetical protein